MKRSNAMCAWRCLFVLSLASPSLRAQVSRDSLVDRALTEFDATRQIQMLVTALNPSLGPPGASWSVGVQLLAQTLIDQRRDSSAAVWLRWAIRLAPDLQPDTVQFLPRTATALGQARDFVARTTAAGDTATVTSWVWSAQGNDEATGRIQLVPPGVAAMQVSVDGVARDPAAPVQLAPGSHEVSAWAAGYDRVHVTREVLPSVTTVLEFRLHPLVAEVPPPQLPTSPPVQSVSRRGRRFPWMWAALGVGGAGAAVWFITRPRTGGITITVPNPP